MFVVKRKAGEAIALGDDVRIVVLAIEGNGVKLGVQAPEGLRIRREGGDERGEAESGGPAA